MATKVSIVVAAYNVERYIAKCLASLMDQTLKEIEVLIVNDGSTDQTKEICQGFVDKDSRFKLINQANAGLSSARNSGMVVANADYIAFVDGDDYVEKTMYESLWQAAIKHEADLVLCGFTKVWTNDLDQVVKAKKQRVNTKLIKQQNKLAYFLPKHDESLVVAWNKLFLRERLIAHHIVFENRAFFEDVGFVTRFLYVAQTITVVEKALYFYRQRENSITSSYNPIIESSYRQTVHLLQHFFEQTNDEIDLGTLELRMLIYQYNNLLASNENRLRQHYLKRQILERKKYLFQLPLKHQLVVVLMQANVYSALAQLAYRKRL